MVTVGSCRICSTAVQRPAELCSTHANSRLPFPPQEPIVIELPGEPKGKGRPRFSRKTGTAYTPPETRSYEAQLKWMAKLAMKGRDPIIGPVEVFVAAVMSVPASWSGVRRRLALYCGLRPVVRPDADNLSKMLDAFNGLVWRDDNQIVDLHISKHYGAKPCLTIKVVPL